MNTFTRWVNSQIPFNPLGCAVWAYLQRQLHLAVCLYSVGLLP
ncbi:MAG: hypothetical protein ACYC4Q_11215 [Victivallaceae bacterium]